MFEMNDRYSQQFTIRICPIVPVWRCGHSVKVGNNVRLLNESSHGSSLAKQEHVQQNSAGKESSLYFAKC